MVTRISVTLASASSPSTWRERRAWRRCKTSCGSARLSENPTRRCLAAAGSSRAGPRLHLQPGRISRRLQRRLNDAIRGPGVDATRLLSEGPSLQRCGDKLTVRAIKLYIDGALGSRGAALLTPYSDSPGSDGLLVNPTATLFPILTEAL